MKNQSKHSSQAVKSSDNADSKLKAAYERDDGYPADQQLEAIKKLVPQKDFSGAESLFD
jgi:hypothetical protein